MLEKAHHALANFANGGMRRKLADALGLAGIAIYNLLIRFRLQVQRMNPIERDKIPSGFRSMPAHLNHSRLAVVNKLAREWGLSVDVHKDVKLLGGDNGERFLSVYHVENEKRKKHILYLKNGRCTCELCAGAPDKSTGDNNNNTSSTTKRSFQRKNENEKSHQKMLQ